MPKTPASSTTSCRPSRPRTLRCGAGRATYFGALTAVLSIIACTPGGSEDIEVLGAAAKEEAASAQPTNIIEGGTFRYSERGEAVHMLVASKLERIDKAPSASEDSPIRVSGGFTLYLDGDATSWAARLEAQRGIFNESTLRLTAYEQVVLENEKGDRLETEELVWANDSDRVWTRRHVTITTDDGVIHGDGLESDGRFEDYVILNPRGAISIEMAD